MPRRRYRRSDSEDLYEALEIIEEAFYHMDTQDVAPRRRRPTSRRKKAPTRRKPRKLSGWQRFIKNKRNHIKFKSGSKKGRLNLKAMAVKYRKTPAGKKKK